MKIYLARSEPNQDGSCNYILFHGKAVMSRWGFKINDCMEISMRDAKVIERLDIAHFFGDALEDNSVVI